MLLERAWAKATANGSAFVICLALSDRVLRPGSMVMSWLACLDRMQLSPCEVHVCNSDDTRLPNALYRDLLSFVFVQQYKHSSPLSCHFKCRRKQAYRGEAIMSTYSKSMVLWLICWGLPHSTLNPCCCSGMSYPFTSLAKLQRTTVSI